MKPSKKVWLILGAVAIVAALVSLYMVYSPQAGERDELNNRLQIAQNRLPTLIAQKNNLENELANAQSLLNNKKVQFPESISSIEYGEYLFELADECYVNLSSLVFPKPAYVTAGAVTYSVVSLTLPISGALPDIFAFIDALRTDERFTSTEVTSISMNVADSAATITINIYGYKG